jgi:hypothetical protein
MKGNYRLPNKNYLRLRPFQWRSERTRRHSSKILWHNTSRLLEFASIDIFRNGDISTALSFHNHLFDEFLGSIGWLFQVDSRVIEISNVDNNFLFHHANN